ncbi:MAG: ABC transporter permease [Planctomycetes bacterium]|nr:ABC transporter permease [Planctomycetota bacterium]
MANKILLVAQREYLENIRTKTFWLGILAFPAIFAIAIGVGWIMEKTKKTQVYTVADFTTNHLGAEVEAAARAGILLDILQGEAERQLPEDHPAVQQLQNIEPGMVEAGLKLMPEDVRAQLEQRLAQRKEKYRFDDLTRLGLADLPREELITRLNAMAKDGRLFGYFVFENDPVAELKGSISFVSENTNDNDLRDWYGRAATRVVQKKRIAAAGIDAKVARYIREPVVFPAEQPGEGADRKTVERADRARNLAPVAFVYLLWMAIFGAAQMLLTNTVEEKSNRIIEVLLSSCSPGELMAGKIWGIGATGLTMVVSWAVVGVIGMSLGAQVLPIIGELDLLGIARDPLYLASFIGYFLTGYLLFAAVLVAIGSVCNSLKEAQNLVQPVFLLLMVPLFAMFPIVQEPNGLMARVFTYIPLYTPFAMMNRASGPPPAWEYAATTVLILFSVWFAFKAAGKIFRVGVLMTGNPPKLKEILGWLKES